MNMITSPAEIVILMLILNVWFALRIEITEECSSTVLKAAAVGVCFTLSGTGGNVENTFNPPQKAGNISGKIDERGRTVLDDRP